MIGGKERAFLGPLLELIQEYFGLQLKSDKYRMLLVYAKELMQRYDCRSEAAFYHELMNNPQGEICSRLLERITTNYTYFMREQPHFDLLREQIIPWWKQTIHGGDLRIWSAGCSSGEEPFTIAMLLEDAFRHETRPWDRQLLATDISEKVLMTAVQGIYAKSKLSGLPQQWRKHYFEPIDSEFASVSELIRRQVLFQFFNLMEARFPFKRKFHAIFCRNVMIYFDPDSKQQLIRRFYAQLEPGGYLFIGHSETLRSDEPLFRFVQPAVYRKE